MLQLSWMETMKINLPKNKNKMNFIQMNYDLQKPQQFLIYYKMCVFVNNNLKNIS